MVAEGKDTECCLHFHNMRFIYVKIGASTDGDPEVKGNAWPKGDYVIYDYVIHVMRFRQEILKNIITHISNHKLSHHASRYHLSFSSRF